MREIQMKKGKLVYLATIFVTLLIGIIAYILPTEDLRAIQSPIYDLNQHWSISSKDKVDIDINLPTKVDVEPNENYVAERVFEDDFPAYMKLRIRSSMQSLRVLIDREEIFSSEKPSDGYLSSPDASVWYFIELPEDVKGKTLTLVMNSSIKSFSGIINPIYYGRGDSLIYDLIIAQRKGVIVTLIILLLGILAIIISFFFINIGDNRLLYLGLFTVSIGIWMLSEARMLQLFTGNRFILGGISYMMLTIMPIPLLLYLVDTVLMRYKRLIMIIIIVFSLDFIINLILQLMGIVAFFNTILVTNGLILITVLLIIFFLFREMIHFGSSNAKKFLLYIGVFSILIIVEIIQFYNQNFYTTSLYSRVGIIIFFGFLSLDSFYYIDDLMGKEKETEVLRKLAYRDILTGGPNRVAFEKDIDELIGKSRREDFRLVMFDVNGLKFINDQYGHQEGDKAIITCYQFIKESFNNTGECYRLGGDEFVCIIKNPELEIYEKGIISFKDRLIQSRKELDYDLDVAVGSDVFTFKGNCEIHSLLHDVDQLMYEDKRRIKTESVISM